MQALNVSSFSLLNNMNGDGLGIAVLHLARFRSSVDIMILQCAEELEDYALNHCHCTSDCPGIGEGTLCS